MKRKLKLMVGTIALVTTSASVAQPTVGRPAPEIEESGTATLPSPKPHWIAVNQLYGLPGVRILDGDTGKMMGQLHISPLAGFAFDPKGRYFYLSESIWTKGNRGTRQDILTVRDSKTFKVVREITLPGRFMVGSRKHILGVSTDGRQAYVYNMDPATSIIVVDLEKNKVAGTIEVPGCTLSAAAGTSQILSLCSDGTLSVSSVSGKQGTSVASKTFFSAENDPVFDNFAIDSASGSAVFVSYTGLVTLAKAGAKIELSPTWSLQEAAGFARASTDPLVPSWYPGGNEPYAVHHKSGKLFVLMHMGEYWSQKEAGSELWVVNTAERKVVKRVKLKTAASNIAVSQDDKPLLYLASPDKVLVLDATTLEEKFNVEMPDGMLYTLKD